MEKAIESIKAVKEGKTTVSKIVENFLDKIKKEDGQIKAFLEVFEESAKKQAAEIDKKIAEGREPGSLAGAVFAIKDNMLYEGHEITCASKILKGHISSYNSYAVQKLLQQDGIIIGRTNMDEFAMGSSCENSAFAKTANPINHNLVPGGSSGGSAAAVKAGFCHIAYGSDTGGSIRQPASFCGIWGMKPTYGRVSRYGLVAFASSLDQIGPMANSPEDLLLGYKAVKGFDEKDSTSLRTQDENGSYKGLKGLKIALIKGLAGQEGLEKDLAEIAAQLPQKLSSIGAQVMEIDFKSFKYALPAYYILASSEASSNLARFDGFRYGLSSDAPDLMSAYMKNRGAGFGPEVKRRILLGTHSLSSGYYDAYYLKAQNARDFMKKELEEVFSMADIIITPTAPTAAFALGEKISDPLSMYLSDIFTIPVNMAGICALSFPYGQRKKDGMPYGLQIISARMKDEFIIKAAGDLSCSL